jgi:hypothetical protein
LPVLSSDTGCRSLNLSCGSVSQITKKRHSPGKS